jgi:transposase
LVLAMAGPDNRRSLRLGWSRWRRAHQAVAARCHAARRALKQQEGDQVSVVPPLPLAHRALSDAEWERIRSLLPPQKPSTGRPRHDHRTVLNGILAVVGTELSWREMPQEYGKRDRAYKRYRLWCDQGLWPRIVDALAELAHEVSL